MLCAVCFGGCAGCALVFGIVALTTKKSLIIVTTSICGAFGFTLAFDQLFLTQSAPLHLSLALCRPIAPAWHVSTEVPVPSASAGHLQCQQL
jgi:hypothetical protein